MTEDEARYETTRQVSVLIKKSVSLGLPSYGSFQKPSIIKVREISIPDPLFFIDINYSKQDQKDL